MNVQELYGALDGVDRRMYVVKELEDRLEDLKARVEETKKANQKLEQDVAVAEAKAAAKEATYESKKIARLVLVQEYEVLRKKMDAAQKRKNYLEMEIEKVKLVTTSRVAEVKKVNDEWTGKYMENPKVKAYFEKKNLVKARQLSVNQKTEALKEKEAYLAELTAKNPDAWEKFETKCYELAKIALESKACDEEIAKLKEELQKMSVTGSRGSVPTSSSILRPAKLRMTDVFEKIKAGSTKSQTATVTPFRPETKLCSPAFSKLESLVNSLRTKPPLCRSLATDFAVFGSSIAVPEVIPRPPPEPECSQPSQPSPETSSASQCEPMCTQDPAPDSQASERSLDSQETTPACEDACQAASQDSEVCTPSEPPSTPTDKSDNAVFLVPRAPAPKRSKGSSKRKVPTKKSTADTIHLPGDPIDRNLFDFTLSPLIPPPPTDFDVFNVATSCETNFTFFTNFDSPSSPQPVDDLPSLDFKFFTSS